MKYIDTPAGKFQVFINGKPADFESSPGCPYTYHDASGAPVPILACYQVSLHIQNLPIGDVIEAKLEHGVLKSDGGGEAMCNAVGHVGAYVIGIGTADTGYLEQDADQRQLPYENYGLSGAGFTFRIVDDPNKFTAHPIQQSISFIIAWESSKNEHAWDIVSFMTS